jgi:hypothetical protein
MKAIITKPAGFTCSLDGFNVQKFALGAEVEGQVAVWALAQNAAEESDEDDSPAPVAKSIPAKKA